MANPPQLASTKRHVIEVVRQSEAYLDMQAKMAIAADQRATTFAGFLVTSIIALVGASAVSFLSDRAHELGWIAIVCALGFAVCLFLALYAARPVNFEYVGNTFSSWKSDIDSCKDYHECLFEQAQHYDDQIKTNNEIIEKNAKMFKAATFGTFAIIAFGGLFFAGAMINLGIWK